MKPYQRGDVVIIDVPMLANSHIQAGKRPWVVVQNNVGNQFSSTSIVISNICSSYLDFYRFQWYY